MSREFPSGVRRRIWLSSVSGELFAILKKVEVARRRKVLIVTWRCIVA